MILLSISFDFSNIFLVVFVSMFNFNELLINSIADVLSDVIIALSSLSSAKTSIADAIAKISGSVDDEVSFVFSTIFSGEVSLKRTAKAALLLSLSVHTLPSVATKIYSFESSSSSCCLIILAVLNMSLLSLVFSSSSEINVRLLIGILLI